jgi:hypothetical protein
MADAIKAGIPSRLNRDFTLHTTEVALALGGHLGTDGNYTTTTDFDPVSPMNWEPSP